MNLWGRKWSRRLIPPPSCSFLPRTLDSYIPLDRGVPLPSCSSKAQPLYLTLDEGYLLKAAPPALNVDQLLSALRCPSSHRLLDVIQAASQKNVEQLHEENNASIRSWMKLRINDLESELSKVKTLEEDSHKAELEKYKQLYLVELEVRKSLEGKLDKTHGRLAVINSKLEVENEQNKSFVSTLSRKTALEPPCVGNFNNPLVLNGNLTPRAKVSQQTSCRFRAWCRSDDEVMDFKTKHVVKSKLTKLMKPSQQSKRNIEAECGIVRLESTTFSGDNNSDSNIEDVVETFPKPSPWFEGMCHPAFPSPEPVPKLLKSEAGLGRTKQSISESLPQKYVDHLPATDGQRRQKTLDGQVEDSPGKYPNMKVKKHKLE
ncbi:ankyrin repeat domain-containing protein 26-like [Moschus berezovskii]|uniref:ankyrin repeat domain-containing protein 26-like n=1 Tax=Moschus berezovskii TaxID=68408 RepID=UPI002443CB34|nr:ankyrin repeat domain-containing protein 26-like [Moschus berezovskii]